MILNPSVGSVESSVSSVGTDLLNKFNKKTHKLGERVQKLEFVR
jgi:hypothetical protein